MNKHMEAFSKNLKLLMGNLTVSQLSREIDIPQPTLSRYLHCQREISLENLIKIADYFNESIDFLIGRKDY